MPARRNLFQDVVAIIQRHMAGDARVEESAMLVNRLTGEEREVDVVIRSEVARHPVIVSVEATSGKRPADVEWVERMVGKHRNLPTNRLVLVSEGGFSDQARELAEREEAIALAPVDLEGGDAAAKIVGRLKSLWPKVLSLTPESVRVEVEPEPDRTQWFRAEPDHPLYLEDGSAVATVSGYFHRVVDKRFPELADQLGLNAIAEDKDAWFVLETEPRGVTAEARVPLFVRWEETDPPELHRVSRLFVTGRAKIEVRELPLRHMRLGEVRFARGETELAGKPTLVVITEGESGGKVTMRPLPTPQKRGSRGRARGAR